MLTETKSSDLPETHYAARHTPPVEGPADTLIEIPLGQVCPAPNFNPRKHFDEASLVGLAESIHSQGVQQPIVVRSCEPKPHTTRISPANDAAQLYSIYDQVECREVEQVTGKAEAEERARQLSECRYHIVMGERRWRASFIAGIPTIPAIVRDGLDESEYKVRALLENIQRQDLDPIEEAEGYRELAGLGYTQEQIGEMVGRGQTAIAKALRLLKMPEDVRELLRSGQLSVSHGLAILRFAQFPAVMSRMAALAIERRTPSKTLEGDVPFSYELDQAKLIVLLRAYEAGFDFKEICAKCPFDAYRLDGHYHVCLKPSHYAQLQAEAQAALQETLREASEAARLRAEEAQRTAEEALAAATTKKERERAQKDVEAAAKAVTTVKSSLPKLRDLRDGTFARIEKDCPAECTSACPCRSKAQDYSGSAVDICIEPGRHNRFKAAHNRDAAKERRERFDRLKAKIKPLQGRIPDTRGLALIAFNYLTSSESGKSDALKAVTLPEGASPDVVAIMQGSYAYSERPRYWNALAALPAHVLINLVTEVMLRQEMHQAHEYKSDSIPRTAWWLGESAASNDRVEVRTYAGGKEVMRAGTRVSFQGGFVTVLLDGETSPSSHEADRVKPLLDTVSSSSESSLPECIHCGHDIVQGESFRMVEAAADYFEACDDPTEHLFCLTCKTASEAMEADKMRRQDDAWSYDQPQGLAAATTDRANGMDETNDTA